MIIISNHIDQIFCKHYKSSRICKTGIKHNQLRVLQLYKYEDCHKKFSYNIEFEKKRVNLNHIMTTLCFYFSGESLWKIQKYLKTYDVKISHVAVYNWIVKHYKLIDQYTRKFISKVGNKWHVDKVFLKVKVKGNICMV